ncbi:UDP-glucosyltransferase 29 [Camellia lanceoleosa]|uniref:UDP-glucosyltransferase 29 n=1 Tax=Camellia lanceoleosa TaxID=1840588 RepID=A0ACC0IYZ9_9ERIC|nr:UDP-glucosyltransferase 29 [Camellia lanceoleosa]
MDSKQSKMNVLMLPWLAHGHISPFLELAKKLSERNFHIYLCSTPINLDSIKKRITDKLSLSIELVEIHLPSMPELPPHHHTTNGLPLHLNSTLQKAFEMASPNFSNILKTLGPDLVIHDFYPSWAPSIASSNNIPAIKFVIGGAAVLSVTRHVINHDGGVEFPFPAIKLQGYHETQYRHFLENAKASRDRQVAPVNEQLSCNLVLFNTCRELEGKYIDYLSVIGDKKVVPVGPLIQGMIDDENEQSDIIQWLDNKGESSTVFVSVGTKGFVVLPLKSGDLSSFLFV